jgi:CRP/FNR family transcriptional regulator, cyclic AMP receptor protein
MSWFDLLGYLASLSVFATFCMNTMVPLRLVALSSNILFSTYGLIGHLYPVLILHVVLFPINLYRLIQIRRLIRSVRAASNAGISIENLLPFMRQRRFAPGEVVFRKGDIADRLFYVTKGSLVISELGIEVGPGAILGEIGVFAPDQKRTASVVARTDCEVWELASSKAKELYYQDPSFGFAVLSLIVKRLVQNDRLAQSGAVAAS